MMIRRAAAAVIALAAALSPIAGHADTTVVGNPQSQGKAFPGAPCTIGNEIVTFANPYWRASVKVTCAFTDVALAPQDAEEIGVWFQIIQITGVHSESILQPGIPLFGGGPAFMSSNPDSVPKGQPVFGCERSLGPCNAVTATGFRSSTLAPGLYAIYTTATSKYLGEAGTTSYTGHRVSCFLVDQAAASPKVIIEDCDPR